MWSTSGKRRLPRKWLPDRVLSVNWVRLASIGDFFPTVIDFFCLPCHCASSRHIACHLPLWKTQFVSCWESGPFVWMLLKMFDVIEAVLNSRKKDLCSLNHCITWWKFLKRCTRENSFHWIAWVAFVNRVLSEAWSRCFIQHALSSVYFCRWRRQKRFYSAVGHFLPAAEAGGGKQRRGEKGEKEVRKVCSDSVSHMTGKGKSKHNERTVFAGSKPTKEVSETFGLCREAAGTKKGAE